MMNRVSVKPYESTSIMLESPESAFVSSPWSSLCLLRNVDTESCAPAGGMNAKPLSGRMRAGMAEGEVGEWANGDVGADIEPPFLELAEALKWPHLGHAY